MKTSTTIKHVSATHSTTSSNLIKYHNFTKPNEELIPKAFIW